MTVTLSSYLDASSSAESVSAVSSLNSSGSCSMRNNNDLNNNNNNNSTGNDKLDRTEHSFGMTTRSLDSIDEDEFFNSDDEFVFDDYLSGDGDSYIFSSMESINSSSVGYLNLSLTCSERRFGCFDIPEEGEEEEADNSGDEEPSIPSSLHMTKAHLAFNSQGSLPSLDSIQENDTLFGSQSRYGESSSSFTTIYSSGDSSHHRRTAAGNEVVQLCPVLPAVNERMAKKKALRWDTNNVDGSVDSIITSTDQIPQLALRRESVESIDRNKLLNIWIGSLVEDQTPQMVMRRESLRRIITEAPITGFEGFHIDGLDQDERQDMMPNQPMHIVTPPQKHRKRSEPSTQSNQTRRKLVLA